MVNFISLVEVLIILIIGIYFSCKLKFIQFNFFHIFKDIFKREEKKTNYSSLSLLLMVLGGRIGVGSIAGVALSIYLGGIGSLFWLLVSSLITAVLVYIETIAGQMYKIKDHNTYYGGPSYYLEKGLNNRFLGIIYASLIIGCYIGGFISIQSNTLTKSIGEIIYINPVIIALLMGFITGYAILGGLNKIIKITSKIVIIMMLLYLTLTLYVGIINIHKIPSIIEMVLASAFNFKSFIGGTLSAIIIGVQRGLFANEAGLGTSSIATSLSDSTNFKQQGYIQILGVYITTFLICLATSLIILTSNFNILSFNDLNGIEIVQYAFLHHFGYWGNIILTLFVFMFAYSTIVTGYYYGEVSLHFLLKKQNKTAVIIIRLITIIMVMMGCLLPSKLVWMIVDILMPFLVIINLYALFKLREKIITYLLL